MTQALKFTSCQAPNADWHCAAIVRYVGEQLGIRTVFVDNLPWQERERLLDTGEIQVGWICGLPYVRKVDRPDPAIELLAAPVMSGKRYEDRPVYFSDVVVRADSSFHSFADLRGARWAYNEPGSHSGYNVIRYHLARLGELSGYFGQVVESGAHQHSLRMILAGEIDASAIDSTVLETELEHQPEIAHYIRFVEVIGPSPIPPWVVSKHLDPTLKAALRDAFLTMHTDPRGSAVLHSGRMTRFAAVTDRGYDPIREMTRLAEPVRW